MTEKDNNKKLYLIDVSGLIFRAFHSIPATMTNTDGVPINSVFGVCSMLTGLRNTFKDDYVVAVFDAGKHTFRNDIYEDYKAHRPPLPAELIPQFPLIRDAINAFGLPVVELLGYEADDVIATLAAQADRDNVQVIIVSSDKDLMQLVNGNISMLDTMKNKRITPVEVMEKFGVSPDKVIEVQALSGDSADNIPGIPGIGPKISAQLINEFGDVESLMEKVLDSAFTHKLFTKKRRENLQNFTDDAFLSKKLVTLVKDVPLEYEYKCYSAEISDDNLYDFYSKHNFKSLIRKLEISKENTNGGDVHEKTNNQDSSYDYESFAKTCINVTKNYQTIDTITQLKEYVNIAKEKPILAFDTETTGLDSLTADLVGVSFSHTMGEAVYIPFAHAWQKENNDQENDSDLFGENAQNSISPAHNMDDDDLISNNITQAYEIIKDILEDKAILKIAHNSKYDTKILANPKNGDIHVYPIDDTLVMSYVLDSTSHKHSLDVLAKFYFDHDMIKFTDLMGKGKNKLKNFSYVNKKDAVEYGAEDSDYAFRLYAVLKHRIHNEKMARMYEFFERPLIDVLSKMESRGVRVDKAKLLQLEQEFTLKSNALKKEIYQLAGTEFNIGSPKQLGEILFERLAYKGGSKTKAGAWKTDEKILNKLVTEGTRTIKAPKKPITNTYEISKKITAWQGVKKLNNTYTVKLLSTIHHMAYKIPVWYHINVTPISLLWSYNHKFLAYAESTNKLHMNTNDTINLSQKITGWRKFIHIYNHRLYVLPTIIHNTQSNINTSYVSSERSMIKLTLHDTILQSTAIHVKSHLSYKKAIIDEDGRLFPKKIMAWREVEKLKNTYVLGLLSAINEETNRIHTSYVMTGTSTGRLASSDPNLQNIPIRTEAGKKIRKVFIAKEDHMLISVDYSQVELRLLAHVAKVESLKYAFNHNIDVHSLTASQAFGIPLENVTSDDRRKAKSINFGIVYGMGAFGLAGQLSISNTQAKSYIDAYFKQYPGIQDYMIQQKELSHESSYVSTFQGRKCALPSSKFGSRSMIERVAINAPIQGGAADIIKRAMINVERKLTELHPTLGAELLLQVHDELIIEAPTSQAKKVANIVKIEMEKITQELNVSIPLIADIGIAKNWYDAH